jgi:hypothetical protein
MLEEFLKTHGILAYKLSKDTFIPQTRISEILKQRRIITAVRPYDYLAILVILLNFGWDFKTILTLNKEELTRKTS